MRELKSGSSRTASSRNRGDNILLASFYTLLLFLAIIMVYPFLNILASSISGYTPNAQGTVFIVPQEMQFGTMRRVMSNQQFLTSFSVSIQVALFGTGLSLVTNTLAAYVLSRSYLPARSSLTVIFVFTMFFSGGIVPNYILMRSLSLLNTTTVLFLPSIINVYNMLVLKSSFEELPPSLEESAKLDGASNFTIMTRIAMPLCKPTYAAVTLFWAVGYWNEYMSALLYNTKAEFRPLQLHLINVIDQANDPLNSLADSAGAFVDAPQAVRSATIIATILPVLIVYPFLQKYFVQGIMIGSVKE